MRRAPMLASILRVEFKDPILLSLELQDQSIREHEQQSGEGVTDFIWASQLSSSITSPKIRENLALEASRLPYYTSVRDEVA